jgi:carotenoid cleavage dioxygenase
MGCRLHRWRFNLKTGATTEQRLDDRILEFGMINQRYAAKPYKIAYSAVQVPGWFLFHGYVKHNLETGQSWEVRLPEGQYASEAPFAPRINAKDEDDGYLVVLVWNPKDEQSEIQIFDCKGAKMAEGPIARVILPRRIPHGFHATYVSQTTLNRWK